MDQFERWIYDLQQKQRRLREEYRVGNIEMEILSNEIFQLRQLRQAAGKPGTAWAAQKKSELLSELAGKFNVQNSLQKSISNLGRIVHHDREFWKQSELNNEMDRKIKVSQ
jgi:hypothetical protein